MASKSTTTVSSCEEYHFVESPLQDYFCPVTFAVLLEPYQTQCCGNHLSQEAYQRLQGQPCPVCKEDNLTAMRDKYHKRRVLSLMVRCPHKAEGCEWEGELGSLEQHLNTTSVGGGCQYVAIECPYSCNERVQKRNLEEHKSRHCPLRPFTCQYCNHKATYQEVTKEHWPVCEKYPLPCPNECGEEEMERQHLKGHLEQTCPLEVIQCEYSYAGCRAQLQRRLVSAHIKENMEAHLFLMTQEVPKLHKRNCQLVACIKQQGKQIKQQGIQMKQDRDEIKQQADQIKQQEDQIKQQEDQIKQDRVQIKQQGDQIKQQGDKIKQQGDKIKQQLKQWEFLIEQIKRQRKQDIPPVDIVMVEFREHKSKADVWYSPPFYSHLGGYKMCLKVDVNGYGDRKGTHVSVFVHLMKGVFDDALKWPFCGDVTVQLRQIQCVHLNRTHVRVISMNQSTQIEPRQRPIGERNEIGLGLKCYISHEEIHLGGFNYYNILNFCVSEVTLF